MAAPERYHARMQRVLDYIDQHLDEDLGLERLSRVAAFSKHHFHRQFTATFGISLHRYIHLLRMKRASYRLAFRADAVTEIALDAGYEAPEAFARAFRQRLGQTPTAFRQSPEWDAWGAAFGSLTEVRTMGMPSRLSVDQVEITEVAPIRVAVMEHRGAAALLGATIQRFIAWRKATGLVPKVSATFTVFHDPDPALPEDFRIDLCAATDRAIAANADGVKPGLIPGGRCARLRVVGASDDLAPAASWLYRTWLPASGEEVRDFPLYCQRVTFFPDVPEHEAVTDLFLPLQ